LRVFICHSFEDKRLVEAFSSALRERGFDPWLDKWEIGPSDDIVARINSGLDEAHAGIIVFSSHTCSGHWAAAEVSYLAYARIADGSLLVPVVLGEDAIVPALLRPLARHGVHEIGAIAVALRGRHRGLQPGGRPEPGRVDVISVSLRETALAAGPPGVRVEVRVGEQVHGCAAHPAIPAAVLRAQAGYLVARGTGRRPLTAADRIALEGPLMELGHALWSFCLPGSSGQALVELLNGSAIGTQVEVRVEVAGPAVSGLFLEALRLPDDRLLVNLPACVMLRRFLDVNTVEQGPLAAPLKVLVAVGAPDEGETASVVLDYEQELQNILDAVEPMHRFENAEVRILEVGHPEEIAKAIEIDSYHVLHISCHGRPGALELENEDGGAVLVSAQELIEPLVRERRPFPLVFLNSCHGAVQDGHTASLAEALLRSGAPAVLAMQTSVSDRYGSQLARCFYAHLARDEQALASRALAHARKELERQRYSAIEQGDSIAATLPEYATAALFLGGDEQPLIDFTLEKHPLRVTPVLRVSGPVPQLAIGDLVGRRRELRACLRALRDEADSFAGVVLTGTGGIGKSAVAGRAMQRLREDGYLVPAHVGRVALSGVLDALRTEVEASRHEWAQELLPQFDLVGTDDGARLRLIARVLSEQLVVLVLDDFEQNLALDGRAFRDASVEDALRFLAEHTRRGRLLITCRNPIPGFESLLKAVPVGPLSPAQTRKLMLRLGALEPRRVDPRDRAEIVRVLGGHPRSLEFINALLGGEKPRLQHAVSKLRTLMQTDGLDPDSSFSDAHEALQQTLKLGARDIMLEELLAIARDERIDEVLLQVAVSNLPVTPAGVARMLASDGDADPGDLVAANRALWRLQDLALLHRDTRDGSAWVQRWTAEGLARVAPTNRAERCVRAGDYRLWRLQHESHSLADAVEAVRNFIAGGDLDAAAYTGLQCIAYLRRERRSIDVAALAAEILETLPVAHPDYTRIADEEARAHHVLGQSARAFRRFKQVVERCARMLAEHPNRAEHKNDMIVALHRLGDSYRDLGEFGNARAAYEESLNIAESTALDEPNRLSRQDLLALSCERMGDVCRVMSQGQEARKYYQRSLKIWKRLARAEPERSDFQRILSVALQKAGNVFRDLGDRDQAQEAYEQSFSLSRQLALAEPGQAELQHDRGNSHRMMGDFYRSGRELDRACRAYLRSLAILRRLARLAPERTDYQHDLAASYERLGDVFRLDGRNERAHWAFRESLVILHRLVRLEPDRADFQRDLGVSLLRLGDSLLDSGHVEPAHESYQASLEVFRELALAEPDRADYRLDCAVSLERIADLHLVSGELEQARAACRQLLEITERLALAEPDRAEYQRFLASSLVRAADAGVAVSGQDLSHALSSLESLKALGRLDPAGEPVVRELRRLLVRRDRE
jgi:tetratricopeptide (TPR) repeat protein